MEISFLKLDEHPALNGQGTTKNIIFETKDFHAWIHNYKKPGDKDDLHCHTGDQTFLILKGECTITTPTKSAKLLPGSFAMIPKGQFNEAAILKSATNLHAARIFLNWLLSKEGQIVQYFARDVTPVREDLNRAELIPFADQIVGKEASFRDPGLETAVQPKLVEFWNSLWLKGGGTPR